MAETEQSNSTPDLPSSHPDNEAISQPADEERLALPVLNQFAPNSEHPAHPLQPLLGPGAGFGHFLSPAKFPQARRFVPKDGVPPPAHIWIPGQGNAVSQPGEPSHGLANQEAIAGQLRSQGEDCVLPSPSVSDVSLHSSSSGSREAHPEPLQGQSTSRPRFNRALYPGYDENGNRRGLDHLHSLPPPQGNGDYYPSRTYGYPPPTTGGVQDQSANVTSGQPLQDGPTILQSPQGNPANFSPHSPHVDGTLDALSGFPRFPPTLTSTSSSSGTPVSQPAHTHPSPGVHRLSTSPHTPALTAHQDAQGAEAAANPPPPPPVGTPGTANQLQGMDLAEAMGLEPGTPLSLASLRDPADGQKPEYTYPTLIKLAIHDSPKQALTLQEIYAALEKRFQWFATCDNPLAWKNSIRHTLSLLLIFQKKPRPVTEPGKGHYWTIDISKGPGYKRLRKRNKPSKNKPAKSAGANDHEEEQELSDVEEVTGSVDQSKDEGHRVGSGRARTRARARGGDKSTNERTSGSPYLAPDIGQPGPSHLYRGVCDTSPTAGTIESAPAQQHRFVYAEGSGEIQPPQWSPHITPPFMESTLQSQQPFQPIQHMGPPRHETGSEHRPSSDPLAALAAAEDMRYHMNNVGSNDTVLDRVQHENQMNMPSLHSSSSGSFSSLSQSGLQSSRFGQPSFGSSSFLEALNAPNPSTTISRGFMSDITSTTSFGINLWAHSDTPSSSNAVPSFSSVEGPVRCDRNAPVFVPASRPGIEIVNDGGLLRAKRVTTASSDKDSSHQGAGASSSTANGSTGESANKST